MPPKKKVPINNAAPLWWRKAPALSAHQRVPSRGLLRAGNVARTMDVYDYEPEKVTAQRTAKGRKEASTRSNKSSEKKTRPNTIRGNRLSTWQGPRTWQGHDCRVQGTLYKEQEKRRHDPCMSCPLERDVVLRIFPHSTVLQLTVVLKRVN